MIWELKVVENIKTCLSSSETSAFSQLTVLLQAEIGMSWAWKDNFCERVSGLYLLAI